MPVLTLSLADQRAVRALLATEAVHGAPVPTAQVLERLRELVPYDRLEVAVLAGDGVALAEHALDREGDPAAPAARPADRRELVVMVDRDDGGVVRLRLTRRGRPFSDHDQAFLHLVSPVLERVLRERPCAPLPNTLTVSERRVLRQVAAGLSNAGIAERLFIAPSTVRKHLEHSYRKLGVTSRVAALARLQGRETAALDLLERPTDPG